MKVRKTKEKVEDNSRISKLVVKLRCSRCKYEWPYHGKKLSELGQGYSVFTSCPRCRNSNVNLEKHRVLE